MDTNEIYPEESEKGFFKGLLRSLKKKNQKPDIEQIISANNVSGSVYQAGGNITLNVNADKALLEELIKRKGDDTFIILLEEKACDCQKSLLKGDTKNVRAICESLCIATFEGCPDTLRNRFKYYRFLLSIIDGESSEAQEKCKSVLRGDYSDRAEVLLAWIGTLNQISYSELKMSADEDQACILTQFFNRGISDNITRIYADLSTYE